MEVIMELEVLARLQALEKKVELAEKALAKLSELLGLDNDVLDSFDKRLSTIEKYLISIQTRL